MTPFIHRHLVSISDLTREDIHRILTTTLQLQKEPMQDLCKGSILANCFFEPSTRTRLSFEAAMLRLGGAVIGFSEGSNTSTQKGETLSDSIRIIGAYADILTIRHPLEGAAAMAAEISTKPIINAGDGANQHPTQTLLDLFSIQQCQHKVDGLSIVIAGDLKYGRTVHSLCLALLHYQVRLYFVCPETLYLPEPILQELRRKGIKFSFHTSLEEVLPKADILYMTRMQKERMPEIDLKNRCHLSLALLENAKPNLKILHPLPRVDEIDVAIDQTPYAYYFEQAQNGLYVRMALLALFFREAVISVTVLTKNSEETLNATLASLTLFPEVLIFDTGSTDRTLEIAKTFPNVQIIQETFEGFGKAHNRASALATNDWILSIDSDEVLSPELASEILAIPLHPNTTYSLDRHNLFRGKRIKCSAGWYPDRIVRLYHRKMTQFTNDQVHEKIITTHLQISPLSHPLFHTPYRRVDDFLHKMQVYSTLFAEQNAGKKNSSLAKAIGHGLAAFFKSYLFKRGFLGGKEGFIISLYNGHTAYYKYLKLAFYKKT